MARVYPAPLIASILDTHDCNSKRIRSLPAVPGTYFCMALSLYPEAAYEQVFAVVSQALSWMQGRVDDDGTEVTIAKSSISEMRTKIGYKPLQSLVAQACVPLANAKLHPEAFYAGLRLVAIDGSNLEIPDEKGNVKAFGYPGSRTGHASYPQARCALLTECATHAILAANLGAYRDAEWAICQPLLSHLRAGMLCLADRGFDGYDYWQAATASGAELLWRCKISRKLPVIKPLSDGSYLSVIYPSKVTSGKKRRETQSGITVRVIDYALPGAPGVQQRYRLLTTLLDEKRAPALELAAIYHERWEVEAVFDELKIHLLQKRRVLRSKTPDLIHQEFYGWVLAHYAVRWLMYQAATAHRQEPRSLSFTAHVQKLRRAQPQSGPFPPTQPRRRTRWYKALLRDAAHCRCVRSKGLHNPRMVKRRNSPYAIHKRTVPLNVKTDLSPQMLDPLPVPPRKIYEKQL